MKFGLLLATNLDDPNLNNLAPIGLGCIAAALNRDLPDVEVVMRENPDDLISERPDVIGISASTEYYHIATQWASRFKQTLGVPVIIGGIHISLLPESMSNDFDIAVIGEGDVTIVELLQSLIKHQGINFAALHNIPGLFFRNKGQSVQTPQRALIQDLDTLPPIEWKALPFYKDYQAHIVSARGCPYKCAFCASEKFARQHRYYSADSIVREIEYFVVEKGLGGITFYDDLLIANKQRLTTLIQKLEERGLLGKCRFHCQVRANLVNEEICDLLNKLNIFTTGIGIESFSDRILKYYNKTGITGETNQRAIDLLSRAGIRVNPSIIFGAPIETRDDMLTTLRAIYHNCEEGKLTSPAWTLLRPYPGTVIWDYAEQKGLVSRTMDWSLFTNWGTFDMYLCEEVSKDEFRELIHEWQTKISLLRFDTIQTIGGNFIFDQRHELYDNTLQAKETITKRLADGHPQELGDELILNTMDDPGSAAILISGWHEKEEDGTRWIKPQARVLLPVEGNTRLQLRAYIPPKTFETIYEGRITIALKVEGLIPINEQCDIKDFPDGLITIECDIPPNKQILLMTIGTDKSFVPAQAEQSSRDIRELALVIASIKLL
jgi:radical SAM superfamily enzyme YgiQ (UPF0313 family)